jgi:hypothetical protein
MKIAVLTANLGGFDNVIQSVAQTLPIGIEATAFQFNDANFPPITGLTNRLQYRIPKLFGWEMFPGYDIYIWLDGSMSLQHPESVMWFLQQLGDSDMAFFKHPWRKTIRDEVDHIEEKLQQGNTYITSRYKNGLHKEQLALILDDTKYKDDHLFASTAFIYRNTERVKETLQVWWFYQSRYFTCDQVVLPYVLHNSKLKINTINQNIFKSEYITLASKHK